MFNLSEEPQFLFKNIRFAAFFRRPVFIIYFNFMALICVGSMAYDAIETPFGKRDKIVGGAAVYAAYAAANFVKPIQQVSIIGNDFEQSILDDLIARGVQIDGVERVADKIGRAHV